MEDIRTSSDILHLQTNAGSKTGHQKARVPDYGEVWYDKDAIANIFALSNLVNKYRVTFDSEQENAFHVFTKNEVMKFTTNNQGLYVFKPDYSTATNNLVATVAENMTGFTACQIERAK